MKLTKIRYEFEPTTGLPTQTVVSSGGVQITPISVPQIYTLFEPNADHTYANVVDMLKSPRCKKHRYSRKITRTAIINHSEEIILNPGLTPSRTTVQKKGSIWISPEDITTSNPNFGTLYVAPTQVYGATPPENQAIVTATYNVTTTLWISGRKFNLGGYI